MTRTALVFSCDETFAALAKGLVLSLRPITATGDAYQLHLVDIGCGEGTLEWMAARGVQVVKFDRREFLTRSVMADIKQYQDAQLCRPFLPQLCPNHDMYIWIDADIWIQNTDSIHLYRDIALGAQDSVVISPLVDYSYEFFYKEFSEFCSYNKSWFSDTYGATVASTYFNRAILSSGIFALSVESCVWRMWAGEIDSLFGKKYEAHTSLHLAEQTALNYIAYSTGKYRLVDALHNYNCHVGKARRRSNGKVCIDIAPYPEIGVVHLTYSGKKIQDYIDNGLLFEEGKYLTTPEIEKLKMLAHY